MTTSVSRPITVLHLIDSLPREGAEILLYDLLQRSNRQGFRFLVVALGEGGEVAGMIEELGIEVEILRRKSCWDPGAFIRLCRLIHREKADIVHSHLFSSHIWGAAGGRLAGARVLRTEHNMSEWKRPWRARLDRLLAFLTARAIAVSEPVRQSLIDVSGFSPERVLTITNGLNLERIAPGGQGREVLAQLGLPPETRLGGMAAALTEKKGHRYLLEATARVVEQHPNFRLLLLGEGELRGQLEADIRRRDLQEEVILLGNRGDALEIVRHLDLFVMSSVREGLSIALLEALALERPAVVTAVGGAPGVIENGVSGLLVPPADPAALAEGMLRLLEDPEEAREMGRRAGAFIRKKFDFQRMVDAYRDVYLELAGRPRAAKED